MIELKNDRLVAKIAERGAELKSLCHDGKQYLWEGRAEVWGSSAPIMFPICGGLKNDTYTFGGKTYTLQKHGYARFMDFEVEHQTDTEAVLLHRSNEETKKSYPFDYELRVRYSLEGDSLRIEYLVKNLGEETMYFNVGAHEGYYTPEGIEDFDVIFPERETLDTFVLYGNLASNQRMPIIKDTNTLPLYEKYFTIDALVFKDLVSRSAVLRNRKTGRALRVDFPKANYFLLWHKPNSPYICLEPWNGLQDTVDSDGELTHKEGITALAAHEEFCYPHTITVLA
ncbi:MAG: aldose 1-epimerase family protein [Clostridia bacterium]|nr:aldose 1-epimerase family protein [Clostridia bacterium]